MVHFHCFHKSGWLVNWENNVHFHHYIPGISWLKLTLRKGPLVFLKSGTLAVTEMLVWAWTFWMAPLKQKSPTDSPSLSATCRETDWLHSWSGRDWWRLPVGDAKSTVLSWGKSRSHVKLWAGIGRQESRMGTVRTVGEQDAAFWQAVIKRQTQYSHYNSDNNDLMWSLSMDIKSANAQRNHTLWAPYSRINGIICSSSTPLSW